TVFAPAQLWIPIVMRRDKAQRTNNYLRVIARLKPGASIENAQGDINGIAQRIAASYPEVGGLGVKLVPLREQIVGNVRHILLLLLGAVGFVLLIACANVANLQLVRASGRQKEFAIRAALGVGLAWLGIKLVGVSALGQTPNGATASLDLTVLAYTLLVTLLTGILAGLAPIFHTST